jgi:A/G-specific adenine glycosylase
VSSSPSQDFAGRLVRWQATHGRSDLPWQRTRDPYRVWLSEIMLQQTQVATVLGYYERFLARFPTVTALGQAAVDDVMPLWAGLGYYARARNLHACAMAVLRDHGGAFPRSAQALAQLPGIGRSTAAAIAAFCFDERAAILDGNVKRVLTRHFAIEGDPARLAVERRLWSLAESLLPADSARMPAYTQAVMDLGATVCTRAQPRCGECPLASGCIARRDGRTDELPTPRARKAVPLKRAQMLVLLWNDEVLLQQRPGAGLWGGLLALPQHEDEVQLNAALAALAGTPLPTAALPPRRHAFTHFTLEFTPRVARVERALQINDSSLRWTPLSGIERAALPAPVKALLLDLREGKAADLLSA